MIMGRATKGVTVEVDHLLGLTGRDQPCLGRLIPAPVGRMGRYADKPSLYGC